MERRFSHFGFLFAALLLSSGCSPSSTTQTASENRQAVREIELPPEFSQETPEAAASEVEPVPPSRAPVDLPLGSPLTARSRSMAVEADVPVSESPKFEAIEVRPAPRLAPAPAGRLATEELRTASETTASFGREGSFTGEKSESASGDSAFTEVNVFYATDRALDTHPLSAYQFTGQRQLISLLGIGAAVAGLFMIVSWFASRPATAKLSGVLMVLMVIGAGMTIVSGDVQIEKTGVMYSGDRGQLVRGVCRVTVPRSHVRGSVERPSLMKFEINEDQSKHIVLTSVEPLPSDKFVSSLNGRLAASKQPDLMVFIHGYNVDFQSAVTRTAQISVDLPFEGVPICYSWPSQGTLLGYPIDENNAAWTVGHLKQFLTELVEHSDAKSIHVVAHSMGNRAMTAALQQMSYQQQTDQPIFDRVVLAAPDVDADLFRKDLAPSLTRVAKQVTLYASSDDQALIASKQVHGYPRAGETGEHLVVVPGVDTIDVSGIDLSLLGHSYYGDNELMLRDLFDVLLTRLPAPQRATLVSRSFQSQAYWQLAGVAQVAHGRHP